MDLRQEKDRIRELLPRGIEEPLQSLKKILPRQAPKYQLLLLLESRLRELQQLEVQGVL